MNFQFALFLFALFLLPLLTVAQYDNQLVMSWPPGFCKAKGCKPGMENVKKFLIHGLWPRTPLGDECLGDRRAPVARTLPSQKVLHDDLKRLWPALGTGIPNNEKFWQHEWTEHGYCMLPKVNFIQYFGTTIDLSRKVSTMEILESADIEVGKTYPMKDFKDRVKNLRHKPEIACGKGNIIVEVRYCTNATHIKDCASTYLVNCLGNNIEFTK